MGSIPAGDTIPLFKMTITYESILADLKVRFGSRILLTPKDIASLISKSEGVQVKLRLQGRFPIPIKHIGKSVLVSANTGIPLSIASAATRPNDSFHSEGIKSIFVTE